MRELLCAFVTLSLLLAVGCQPEIAEVKESSEPAMQDVSVRADDVDGVLPLSEEVQELLPAPDLSKTEYIVLNEPWDKYFRSQPKLLVVPSLSAGMGKILKQEQTMIKSVLDSGGEASNSSDYVALQDKLEELKTIIPQAETGKGYVRQNYRSGRYSYASGGSIYVRSSRYYYDGYYTVLREKTMSSSPAMTRSVEGIAHNATLEDLDQRVDALRKIQQSWSRKTAGMSTNGSAGIMRAANEAYLKGLREYTQAFQGLQKELRSITQKQDAILRDRNSILAQWKTFEETRLALLDEYLNENAAEVVTTSAEGVYMLPDFSHQRLLYACEIGERTLYFDLTNKHSELHPFVLVNVAPVE